MNRNKGLPFLQTPGKWQLELPEPSLSASSRARPSTARLRGQGRRRVEREPLISETSLSLGTRRNKGAEHSAHYSGTQAHFLPQGERVGGAVTQEGPWTRERRRPEAAAQKTVITTR